MNPPQITLGFLTLRLFHEESTVAATVRKTLLLNPDRMTLGYRCPNTM